MARNIQAGYDAIGEEIAVLAGIRETRTTVAHAAGATTLHVETTFEWDSTGAVMVEGERYTYSGKTGLTLTGISPPLIEALSSDTVVVDVSGTYSAKDAARRMLFVDTAEEEYLDALGRNLGVERVVGLSDASYRALIKALALAPRGTLYTIERVLEAVLGAGTFTIFEDLVNFPNRVFISLSGVATEEVGRGFLNARDVVDSTSTTTCDTVEEPQGADNDSVIAVFLAPEEHVLTGDVLPSAEPDTPWAYEGTTAEGTAVTLNDDGTVQMEDTSAVDVGARYGRTLRAEVTTEVEVEVYLKVTSAEDANDAACLRFSDGAREISVAFRDNEVRFHDADANTFVGSVVHEIDTTGFHVVKVRKPGGEFGPGDVVELWVDGVLRDTAAYTDFPAAATRTVQIGAFSTTGVMDITIASLRCATRDPWRNYWNAKSDEGDAETASANPARLTASTGTPFLASDDEHVIDVRGALLAHGRGNGRYLVKTVDAGLDFVELEGVPYSGAVVTDVDAVRIPEDHDDGFTAEDAGVQAALTTGANDAAIRWIARYGGEDGDDISVELKDPGAAHAPLSVTVVSTDNVEVTLATDGAGAITSTADDVIAAVNANSSAVALLSAQRATGSDGSGVQAAVAAANLAGGEDGKSLTLTGTNAGTYKIATLVDERNVLLGSHLTPAALTVEDTEVTWRKDPNFTTETGLSWELVAGGTVSGNTLTFRRALSSSPQAVEVHYVTQFSAHLLVNEFLRNDGSLRPLYLSDPFAFVRGLLDKITVAGVIPLYR